MRLLTALYGRYPQHTLLLAAGQTSEPIVRGDGDPNPSVVLYPNPVGAGRVEVSLSSRTDVQDGVASWIPWPSGNVAVGMSDILVGPWTALRAVCLAGDIKVEVRA